MKEYILELTADKIPILVEDNEFDCQFEALDSPDKVISVMRPILQNKAEEYLYMIALTTKGKPIGIFEISHGTVNMSIGNPREIMIRALLAGATSIVLAHNHPSGDVSPSKEDITLTERVKESGKLIGIELVDHLIISNTHFSFLEERYL